MTETMHSICNHALDSAVYLCGGPRKPHLRATVTLPDELEMSIWLVPESLVLC